MINTHSVTNYADDLYNFLKQIEARDRVNGDLRPYFDSKGLVTIGIGFNIEGPSQDGLLRAVLRQFGLDPTDASLSNAQRVAEQGWYSQISSKIQGNYADDAALQTTLNQVMYNRSIDPALNGLSASKKRAYFRFNDGSEVRTVFNSIVPSYESTLDTWLTANGINTAVPDLMVHGNRERMALLSMTWQGWIKSSNPTQRSPKLANALAHNDRAEAWYEIRYNTSTEARRFLEADTFGLYNAGPLGETDYKAAYRTLTRHRDTIFGADGVAGTSDDYERKNASLLTTAQGWGTALAIAVKDLNGNLALATEYLLAQYDVAGIPISWENIFVGEDTTTAYYRRNIAIADWDNLTGTDQSDLIFGESGNDTIDAKGGSDVLYGGRGNDTYIINSNNTGSFIEDKDGTNTVVMNGIPIKFFYKDNQTGFYVTPDKRINAVKSGTDLIITDMTTVGNTVTLNKDFAEGDFVSARVTIVTRRTATYGWLTRHRMTKDMSVQRAA